MGLWPSTDFTIETPLSASEVEARLRPHTQPPHGASFDIAPGGQFAFSGVLWEHGFELQILPEGSNIDPGILSSVWAGEFVESPEGTSVRVTRTANRTLLLTRIVVYGLLAIVVLVRASSGPYFAGLCAMIAADLLVWRRLRTLSGARARMKITRLVVPEV
jgi:hypothetical protein